MSKWYKLSCKKPAFNEPIHCLLDNGQQATLAFDETSNEWVFYDENKLEDAHVIAWKKLETREYIEMILSKNDIK